MVLILQLAIGHLGVKSMCRNYSPTTRHRYILCRRNNKLFPSSNLIVSSGGFHQHRFRCRMFFSCFSPVFKCLTKCKCRLFPLKSGLSFRWDVHFHCSFLLFNIATLLSHHLINNKSQINCQTDQIDLYKVSI